MSRRLKLALLALVGISTYRKLARTRDGLRGHRRRSYSQYGEDAFLAARFADLDAGFYVDVGAHHPRRLSNTYLLYLRGWRGVNIDPIPGMRALFDRVRPGDVNVETAVGSQMGRLRYFQFDEPSCNTFCEPEASARQTEGVRLVRTDDVAVRPLGEVLSAAVPAGRVALGIDLLCVDVEGMDLQVLEAFDFATYRPAMVCVEDHLFDGARPGDSAIYRHLLSRRYRLCAWMGPTLMFERDR